MFILLTFLNRDFLIMNLYGPNRDNPDLYQEIEEHVQELMAPNIILAGDWNLVLNPDIDYDNYKHVNNPRARDKVSTMMDNLDLIDIWRELYPDYRRFTWRRAQTNTTKQTRFLSH